MVSGVILSYLHGHPRETLSITWAPLTIHIYVQGAQSSPYLLPNMVSPESVPPLNPVHVWR